ncbi:retrovirus-related pol polyprotein from transposon TNT 1-94 [Tanacetum coccineum]
MLVDSLLPISFWAEAVYTACYVLNRLLVTKPQNKTPYELLIGKSPSISFIRPFGCPLTILNTLDSLGKFDGKSNEGYLLGYSTSSKAFRVYNKRTKRVEENLHINFLEDQPNVTGTGTQDSYVTGSSGKAKGPTQEYILLPLQPHRTRILVKDVAPAAHEKPSESSPKDNNVQDSEDAADKKEQHQMKEREQDFQDELKMMMLGAWPDFNNMDKLCYRHFSHTQIHKVFKRTNSRRSLHLQFKQEENPKASSALLSLEELRDYITSLSSESWVEAMQENCLVQIQKEEGIDYDEVFDLLPELRQLVYSDQALYGLLSSSSAWYETLLLSVGKMVSEEMSSMGELTFFLRLQVKQQPDGIFISQDKYVADILKKFDFLSIKTATTPIESNKPLVKDEDGVDVHVHVYRSMIGSLMYLTASRSDIMFAVCAYARFQVTLKASHLNAVKRIFRRLISWQCKKQTIVANSTTEAEYVVAANCCGQVLWIQNQMMDYCFNFMNTKIHIDNESTISVIKNPVAYSRTIKVSTDRKSLYRYKAIRENTSRGLECNFWWFLRH